MTSNQLKSVFSPFSHHSKHRYVLLVLTAFWFITANNSALALFMTYTGGASAESDWKTAAGTTVLEDFQSYVNGVQISSLPALGVGFYELDGGGYPNAYYFASSGTPYGSTHLGNFPNGINEINRWDDIVLYVLPGYKITALGFWNGDGQNATLVATAYDASDNVLGSVGAFRNTFAGFVSDAPVYRVVFDGNTGDGWNHLDGLQTNVTVADSIPEPSTIGLLILGICGLFKNRLRK
ncbi:MAG: PEP-CTERM sorting domain-containing protein [Candidatus Auribacter fodinae]|jgi:hypothetical protein|uniref:PEP-CTERM sorting domain-containing protein n=1 Tax=Candidatus Auribacter fodinae TaxID=2093366 RepID=A0A3A4RFY2_9BACT|nr:MAG: PEP-CTERM sorting domain-containing protein [Candidatus Auribacter fodinae]